MSVFFRTLLFLFSIYLISGCSQNIPTIPQQQSESGLSIEVPNILSLKVLAYIYNKKANTYQEIPPLDGRDNHWNGQIDAEQEEIVLSGEIWGNVRQVKMLKNNNTWAVEDVSLNSYTGSYWKIHKWSFQYKLKNIDLKEGNNEFDFSAYDDTRKSMESNVNFEFRGFKEYASKYQKYTSPDLQELSEEQAEKISQSCSDCKSLWYYIQKEWTWGIQEISIKPITQSWAESSSSLTLQNWFVIHFSTVCQWPEGDELFCSREKIFIQQPKWQRSNTIQDTFMNLYASNRLFLNVYPDGYIVISTSSWHEGESMEYLYDPRKNKFIDVYKEIMEPIFWKYTYGIYSVGIIWDSLIVDENNYCCDNSFYNKWWLETHTISLTDYSLKKSITKTNMNNLKFAHEYTKIAQWPADIFSAREWYIWLESKWDSFFVINPNFVQAFYDKNPQMYDKKQKYLHLDMEGFEWEIYIATDIENGMAMSWKYLKVTHLEPPKSLNK